MTIQQEREEVAADLFFHTCEEPTPAEIDAELARRRREFAEQAWVPGSVVRLGSNRLLLTKTGQSVQGEVGQQFTLVSVNGRTATVGDPFGVQFRIDATYLEKLGGVPS
jgi:hypothetical protein